MLDFRLISNRKYTQIIRQVPLVSFRIFENIVLYVHERNEVQYSDVILKQYIFIYVYKRTGNFYVLRF